MTAVRWVSFLLAAECMVCLWFTPRSVLSAVLAALFFTCFLIYCGTFRDSRKATS